MSDNLAVRLRRQVYAKKITGYIVLFLIGMVFVFFGFTGKQGALGIGSVARVNDAIISVADLQGEENRIEQLYASLLGGSMDLSAQRNEIRQAALSNLINTELASQAAAKAGIRTVDQEVRNYILEIPYFQDKGVFLRERYMGYLEATHSTAGDFETKIRKDIQNLRTRHLIEVASLPSSLELKKNGELQSQKMDLAFARLNSEDLAKTQKFPESELKTKMADAAFAQRVEEYFKSIKSEWSREETVKAQHLLIAFKPNDAASEKQALNKVMELRARAQKEDFGKLAAQYSDDPGSKAQKGMLDPFPRGNMVKPFEDAAFSMKVGELSQPVKTQFGYHLIKVLDHQAAKEANFEAVKMEVASRLLGRERVEEKLKELDAATAAKDAAKVDAVLKEMGVAWDNTGFFDLSADAVPKLPPGAVSVAAFEVSSSQPLLGRVIRENGSAYVIKFKDIRAEPAKEDAANGTEVLQRRRADGVYSAWLEQHRRAAKLDVNQEIFRQ